MTITHIRLFSFVNAVRARLGWMLHEWHKRGLEFGVAGASMINARSVLISDTHGKPLAPFLSSALDFLARAPLVWAVFLGSLGAVHMAIVLSSFGREWLFARALACLTQAMVYVGVSVAIITGPAPHEAGERYYFTAWLSFWIGVALLAEAVAHLREGGEIGKVV